MGAKYEAYIESEADGLDISVLAVVPDEKHILYKEKWKDVLAVLA